MSRSKPNQDWTVLSMLEWATDYFEKNEVPSPRLSIEWLLADLLGIKRLELYLQYDRPLTPKELDELRPKVKRRGNHEPLQYIVGQTDFMDCIIEVNPDVLIPRPETEQLVEILLNREADRSEQELNILDIGTGSGCIPIAIGKARPRWRCTGVDKSRKALDLARKNADRNQTEIEFFHTEIQSLENDERLSGQPFDIIISNPPYVLNEERKSLEKEVIDFEPGDALFHESPEELYLQIFEFAQKNLAEDGRLYLECNPKQTKRIGRLVGGTFQDVHILNDYDGRQRFLIAGKKSEIS